MILPPEYPALVGTYGRPSDRGPALRARLAQAPPRWVAWAAGITALTLWGAVWALFLLAVVASPIGWALNGAFR